MARQQTGRHAKEEKSTTDAPVETVEDFTIDQAPPAAPAEAESSPHAADKSTPDQPPSETAQDQKPRTKYDPRNQTPANVIFLPNIARGVQEKDLSDFGDTLPCKPIKTFVYMSDTAYHGFVECASIDDGIKNLEFINSRELMLKNKRVLAEYSRRKNVLDRDTYEKRQHVRRARGDRPPERDRWDEPRPRRRSRSPPHRDSYRSERSRDWDRDDRWSKDNWDYSRGGSSWRDNDWNRDSGKWSKYDKSSWDRGYDDRQASRQRDWDYDYPSRGGASSYQQSSYDQYESARYPPADRQRYPPREQYPPYEPQGYPEHGSYPPAAASYDSYRGEAPLPVLSGSPIGAPGSYRQSPPPASYGAQTAPPHPLLSLQQPVRATPIGTQPQQPSYHYHQYK